jgi:hypothetical protein
MASNGISYSLKYAKRTGIGLFDQALTRHWPVLCLFPVLGLWKNRVFKKKTRYSPVYQKTAPAYYYPIIPGPSTLLNWEKG